MDKQQIKQILDNAPEGATHYLFIGQDENIVMYYRWVKLDEYFVFKGGEFVDGFRPIKIIHNLSDLRTQLALIDENEKLKDALNAAIRACYDLDTHSARHENDDYLKACEILDEVEELSND